MSLAQQNLNRWNNCHIPQAKAAAFKTAADKLMSPDYRARYEAVSKMLSAQGKVVPWWFIAVAHYRESNADFKTYLGNGQSLDKKTTIVPKGRGPFETWEAGAYDALVNCPPYAANNKDWTIGGALAMLEAYNGPGYANKGLPSPYIWSGTDQYEKGKYTSDGKYNAEAVDEQLGCAGILKFMGVFKNAPTGAGTAVAGATVVAGAAAATASYSLVELRRSTLGASPSGYNRYRNPCGYWYRNL
jgi:lysozyme family protein